MPRVISTVCCSLAFALLGPGCGGSSSDASPPGPRHLVLVTIDTLAASRLGHQGHELATSPVLDALAAEGVTCDAHSTSFNATYPSMMSIHTGLYARNHGQYLAVPVTDVDAASTSAPTLAERLRAEGYWCAAVGSHPLWGEAPEGARLFAGWDDLQLIDDPLPLRGRELFANARWTGPALERALDRWRAEAPDRPLFLWAHYFDPHTERVPLLYDPPPETRDLYLEHHLATIGRADLAPRFAGLGPEERHALAAELAPDNEALLELRHALNLSAYDGEVRAVDAAVGDLLDRLEELGVRDEALVAVNADHGENLGTPRERTRAAFTHAGLGEDVVRTPWILAHAMLPADRRVDVPTSNVDLVPTFLAALGLPPAAGLDGVDVLTHVFEGEPLPRDVVYTECGGSAVAVRSLIWKRIDDPTGTSRTYAWGEPEDTARTLGEDARESRALARLVAGFRPSHRLHLRALAHDPPRETEIVLRVPAEELLAPPADAGETVEYRLAPPADLELELRRTASPIELVVTSPGALAPEAWLRLGDTPATLSRAGFVLEPGDTPAPPGATIRLQRGSTMVFDLTGDAPFHFVYGARRVGLSRFEELSSRVAPGGSFRVYPRELGVEGSGRGPAHLELRDARPDEPHHVELWIDGRWPAREALSIDGMQPRPGVGGLSVVVDGGAFEQARTPPRELRAGEISVWFDHPQAAAARSRESVGGELDAALRALGY